MARMSLLSRVRLAVARVLCPLPRPSVSAVCVELTVPASEAVPVELPRPATLLSEVW